MATRSLETNNFIVDWDDTRFSSEPSTEGNSQSILICTHIQTKKMVFVFYVDSAHFYWLDTSYRSTPTVLGNMIYYQLN